VTCPSQAEPIQIYIPHNATSSCGTNHSLFFSSRSEVCSNELHI